MSLESASSEGSPAKGSQEPRPADSGATSGTCEGNDPAGTHRLADAVGMPQKPCGKHLDDWFRANQADHEVYSLHLIGQSIIAAALAVLASESNSPARAGALTVIAFLAMGVNFISVRAVRRAEAFRNFWEAYDPKFFEEMRRKIKAPSVQGRWLFKFFYALYLGIAVYACSDWIEIRFHASPHQGTGQAAQDAKGLGAHANASARVILGADVTTPDSFDLKPEKSDTVTRAPGKTSPPAAR